MKNWIKREFEETQILLRSIPASIMTLFVLALVLMNLLANKELISIGNWLALDCGMLVSWLAFFTMDMIVRRFGPKASIKLTLIATAINLFVALILIVVGFVPNNWAAVYSVDAEYAGIVNTALNSTISNTWYVLMGSTIAFITSSVTHAGVNWSVSKLFKNSDSKSYLITSYISTSAAQFVDNLVFAFIVSYNFFDWTVLQCITCAITGVIMELLFELLFGPVGYKITKRWETLEIGQEYVMRYKEKN